MIIGKWFTFEASHKLENKDKPKEWNLETYGKCFNCLSHGHSYRLHVSLRGDINSDTGMLINFKQLAEVVNKNIIDKVDHKFLNEEVAFLKGKITTCEVMVEEFWKILFPLLTTPYPYMHLYEIELFETADSSAVKKLEE